jgi:predicted RNA-binding protein YlqC (UPF0109 family)
MAHMKPEPENLQQASSAFLAILKLMVNEPEALRLDVVNSATETLFRVITSPNDMGKRIWPQ